MAMRASIVQEILDFIYAEVRKYSNIARVDESLCKSGRMSCDAMVYGDLLIGLQQSGLWSPVEACKILGSVGQLASTIRELKTHSHPQTGGRSGPTHRDFSAFRGFSSHGADA
ncbi:hypothetical protein ONS96_010632 [Cadophora gregata f. sp. sojae]|nr:hypothetical protein ONS96_010632 [Cadophora gregata f. sp. sojae]